MVFWLQINICLSNWSLATDVTRLSHKKTKEILHFLFATISSMLITMVSWLSSIKLCTLEKRELLVLLQSLHPTGSDYLSSHCWLCLCVMSRRLSHWSHPWKIKGSRFDQWCKKYWQITVIVFFALIYHYEVSIDCTVWWLRTTWNAWTCLTTLTAP